MKRTIAVAAAATALALAGAGIHSPGPAQAAAGSEANPLLLLVDISGSMGDDDGTGRIKIDGAKSALLNFLAGVEPGTPLGLRTFPDQSSSASCNNGKLQFPIQPRDPAEMSAFIRGLQANGDTPTAEAMTAAVADMRRAGYTHGTLVLLSDGLATCANPCDVAKTLAQSGIDLETITIGFRISPEGQQELKCIANAMGGHYVDVHDSAGLAKVFAKISRPSLGIKLDYPKQVVAEVGNDPSGLVEVKATITNSAQQQAQDVVARLRFDSGSPGTPRPVRALGNLEPGEAREVTWTFRPGLILAGSTVRFTVVAHAANALSDADKSGAVTVVDETDPRFAGAILNGRQRIAVLGDSYSSGEGSDVYLSGTDTDYDTCHRSGLTYVVGVFHEDPAYVIACSGAVANDIPYPQASDHVDGQLQQLADLVETKGADGVAMTLGGNDARFKTIAVSCIAAGSSLGGAGCDRLIYPNPLLAYVNGTPSDTFLDEYLNDGLANSLAEDYVGIDSVLNSDSAVAKRGSRAPIFVLAYPLPVPLSARSCLKMLDTLSANELGFLDRFAARLNGLVEAAVDAARGEGVPVFFVPNTEDAFLPDHTVCDRKPYARSLLSFNFSGLNLKDVFVAIIEHNVTKTLLDDAKHGIQELLHPNQEGYKAMSSALIRWSLSSAANADAAFLKSGATSHGNPFDPGNTSSVLLAAAQTGAAPTLDAGTTYPLGAAGFAPGSDVEVDIASQLLVLAQVRADARGRVRTVVGIPRSLDPGRHTIIVSGVDANRHPRVVRIPVKLAGPGTPLAVVVLGYAAGAVAVLAALAWLLVLVRRRKPVPQARASQVT